MSIFYWAIPTWYDTVITGGSFSNTKIITNWYSITCSGYEWLNNIIVKNINIFEMINVAAFNIFALKASIGKLILESNSPLSKK